MGRNYEFDNAATDKTAVFQQAAKILLDKEFRLIDLDVMRPWGFFLSVDESQADIFIKEFYSGAELESVDTDLPLRPKFLGIAPGQRLSWQYHHRRAEVWRTLSGSYQLITSETDEETSPRTIVQNEVIKIPQGVRHRGIGLNQWALIAEIWQHTNPSNPSNEDDIVRVQDDFNRR